VAITRRDLLKAGASAATLAAIPRPLLARIRARPESLPPIQDPHLKDLALRAVEAARAAGATYADVRLTHTRERNLSPSSVSDAERIGVGVRALLNGYWGFSSGPVWSADEMARLSREAVHQARTNALGKPRVVDLAPAPRVTDGHWVMPVKLDPFEVSPFEIMDMLASLQTYAERRGARGGGPCTLLGQEKAFASTDGSYCTQVLYQTSGQIGFQRREDHRTASRSLQLLTPAGVGWELFRDQPLREEIRRLIEEMKEDLSLPVKPVEVGRYDTVMDAMGVARLLDGTLGRATELDRALGYEANAGGTSYLNDPFAMVGTYQAGAPLMTVTANRSQPGGAATVKWDDEGVAPDEFTLVKDGMLTDFQTTRESAGWMRESYAKRSTPVRSHGCANAPSGIEPALQHTPNITVASGRETHDFDSLVAGLSTGIAIRDLDPDMDFQSLNGLGRGRDNFFYEVKKGKRVALLSNAGVLFRAPELWKGVLTLGGAASARRFGMAANKGEPAQTSYHSVTTVPALFRQLTVIDALRKA
jgi:TldD protein